MYVRRQFTGVDSIFALWVPGIKLKLPGFSRICFNLPFYVNIHAIVFPTQFIFFLEKTRYSFTIPFPKPHTLILVGNYHHPFPRWASEPRQTASLSVRLKEQVHSLNYLLLDHMMSRSRQYGLECVLKDALRVQALLSNLLSKVLGHSQPQDHCDYIVSRLL